MPLNRFVRLSSFVPSDWMTSLLRRRTRRALRRGRWTKWRMLLFLLSCSWLAPMWAPAQAFAACRGLRVVIR